MNFQNRWQNSRDTRAMLMRYSAMGAILFAVNLAIVTSSVELFHFSPAVAAGAGFTVVFTLGFIFARYAIFTSSEVNWFHQMGRFALVNFTMRFGEYLLFLFLIAGAGLNYVLSLIFALLLSNLLKFTSYRYWVFTSKTQV